MTGKSDLDPIAQAMAATQGVKMARLELTLHSPNGNRPFAIELPTDLSQGDAFIVLRATADACARIIQQQAASQLVLAKGALPEPKQ